MIETTGKLSFIGGVIATFVSSRVTSNDIYRVYIYYLSSCEEGREDVYICGLGTTVADDWH